jgi:hypothetical protein
MAVTSNRVQPGEIIKASLINGMLDDIDALKAAVSQLQGVPSGAGDVAITSLTPSGPIRIGDELQVRGRNFGYSTGAQNVFLDATRVVAFKNGSSDELLIFDIPRLVVQSGGQSVTLLVGNQFNNAPPRSIWVLPADVPLSGNVAVTFDSVSPSQVPPNGSATFRYKLSFSGSKPAGFQIQVAINNTAVAQPVILDDTTGSTIQSGQVSATSDTPVFFKVQLNSTPSTDFILAVGARAQGVVPVDDSRQFSVTQQTLPQDSSISLDNWLAKPAAAFDGSTITISKTNPTQVLMSGFATFTQAGTYKFTAQTAATNWTANVNPATTLSQTTVAPSDLVNGKTPPMKLDFLVNVNPGGPGTTAVTGTVTFQIQNVALASVRSKTYNIALGP